MTLKGWTNPLPDFVEQAVRDGRLTIKTVTDKRYGEYEVLQGKVVAPSGTTIEYQ